MHRLATRQARVRAAPGRRETHRECGDGRVLPRAEGARERLGARERARPLRSRRARGGGPRARPGRCAHERALGEYEVDTVLHLVPQTIVLTANRNPVSALETNVAGTWTLLEACRRAGSSRSCWPRATGPTAHRQHGGNASRGQPSLRRPQVVRRLDRPNLRSELRAAGRDHALREYLRRRRSQLELSAERARKMLGWPRCTTSTKVCAKRSPAIASSSGFAARERGVGACVPNR